MKKVWVATIQVAVLADCEAGACDVISESMRDITNLDGDFIDWQYANLGAHRLTPSHHGDFKDSKVFEEGELFDWEVGYGHRHD